jgi:serine/threonine protein kinase
MLGKGAFGVCFTVKRSSDGKLFAVKEFKKKKSSETAHDYLKRLSNEYKIASLLHHPNIIETIDFIVEKDSVYEVMELCQGGNLYHELKHKQFTQHERDSIFLQLMRGVNYLHQNYISHRDIKPENLVFDSYGTLKIIDFGSACIFHGNEGHECQHRYGSGPYIAPEEFLDVTYDGRKVDIWACGIIYLLMAFKRFPWNQATMEDKLYSQYVRTGHLEMIECLESEDKKELMMGMLNTRSAGRLSSGTVLDMLCTGL